MMDTAIPLRRTPAVVQLGMNVHGRRRSERYRLRGQWGIHLYLYDGTVEVGGRRFDFSAGDLSVTPPDTDLVWRFPAHAPHHYAHVAFPGHGPADLVTLPLISRLGGRSAALAAGEDFDRAIAAFASEPARTTAWCWNLLWRLVPMATTGIAQRAAGVPGLPPGAVHAALQTSLAIIELELDRPITLAGLAQRVGISANHLLRLFHQHLGTTVMGQVRKRRAERARQLLEHSSLPMIDIATAVGAGSLQRLNKLVRQAHGRSPRSFRR